ncbi:hypothetical protein [Mesorhizobium sp.]|uniref:hypothetical protein n=1 Tax=Mesorhizobium sp. TaxID=1871066 RepID=UPI0035645A47
MAFSLCKPFLECSSRSEKLSRSSIRHSLHSLCWLVKQRKQESIMNYFVNIFAKSLASSAVIISLSLPATAGGIGVGGGVSVGGRGGVNAGVGASIGGAGGIGVGAGASVGGSGGVNAGVGASVGGSNGVNAGLGANVGGTNGVSAGLARMLAAPTA